VAVWLHRPHDDRCVSREGCEDFSKETGAALTCLPPVFCGTPRWDGCRPRTRSRPTRPIATISRRHDDAPRVTVDRLGASRVSVRR